MSAPAFTLRAPQPGELIVAGIALANGVRLAWAYAYADAAGNLQSAPGLAGLILGAALSFGTAQVAAEVSRQVAESEMPHLKGTKRTPAEKAKIHKARRAQIRTALGGAGLAILLILEPFILAPITRTHMPAGLATNLPGGWGWAWSAALAVAPSIILAALAFAGGVQAHAPAIARQPSAIAAPAAATARSKPAIARQPAAPEVRCTEPGCGMSYHSKGAHIKAHHMPVKIDPALIKQSRE